MGERNASGVTSAVRGVTGAAGETVKRTGEAARGATGAVSGATGAEAVQRVGQQAQEVAVTAAGAVERAAGERPRRTVGEELREIVREAALEVLVPAARKATREAALYAVRQAPELTRDTLVPKLKAAIEEAGGPGALAKGSLAGVLEKAGAEAPRRPWRERPLPVETSIDVVAPLETVFDRFTRFDEYANVMSRGSAVDLRANERIEWRRTDGVQDTAVITFHRVSDRLTRVMVTYDRGPVGLRERASALFRPIPRGVTDDLMRFKAFVEMTAQEGESAQAGPGQDG